MSLADFGAHLNDKAVHVVYHGGCPDGCLAALVLKQAIVERFKPSSLELTPTSHGSRNADKVTDGSTAIFADVSPTLDDEEMLRKCRCVIILDHHPSVASDNERLQIALPQVSNFSDIGGKECGASVVNGFCASRFVDDWIVHLFHKLDVFEHTLPDDVAERFNPFKGFITQRGFGRCTVELVEEFLADTDAALARGRELYASVAENTKKVFARRSLQADTSNVSVWAVEHTNSVVEPDAIDLELYQSLIDEMDCPKPVIVATLNRTRLSSGLWTVGLRRAGDALDVGSVAKRLGGCSALAFKTGGGHPYAAGAQCSDFELSAERICKEIASICEDMLAGEDGPPRKKAKVSQPSSQISSQYDCPREVGDDHCAKFACKPPHRRVLKIQNQCPDAK